MAQKLSAAQSPYKATARILKTLADPTRLRLLEILKHGEHNVTALRPILDLPQPAVSHHLALLKEADLILARRTGRKIFYKLNDNFVWPSQLDEGLEVSVGSLQLRLSAIGQNGELASSSATKSAIQIEPHTSALAAIGS